MSNIFWRYLKINRKKIKNNITFISIGFVVYFFLTVAGYVIHVIYRPVAINRFWIRLSCMNHSLILYRPFVPFKIYYDARLFVFIGAIYYAILFSVIINFMINRRDSDKYQIQNINPIIMMLHNYRFRLNFIIIIICNMLFCFLAPVTNFMFFLIGILCESMYMFGDNFNKFNYEILLFWFIFSSFLSGTIIAYIYNMSKLNLNVRNKN